MSLSAHGRMARLLMQAVLLLALCVCATQSPHAADGVVALTESQNASTIEIANGQNLEIRLPLQGGTGFSWALERTPSAPVRLVSSQLLSTEGASRPGGTQTQLFVFATDAAGSGDIALDYRRPWETNAPPARTSAVHVVVRDTAR